MCLYVYVLGEEKPGHIPWGDRPRLISNALYERELSHRQISLLLVSQCLHLSPLYIQLFLFSQNYSPLQHTPLYFIHLACCIFSENLSRFHFELIRPPHALSVLVHRIHDGIGFGWKQMPWLRIYLSHQMTKCSIRSCNFGTAGVWLIRWVINLCAFTNDDTKWIIQQFFFHIY